MVWRTMLVLWSTAARMHADQAGAFKLGQAWAIPRRAVEKLKEARPEGGFKRGRKKNED